MNRYWNHFKKIFSLSVILACTFANAACSQKNNFDPNQELISWSKKDFSKNTQLFLIRQSSIAYYFSTALITSIAEQQIKNNSSCNIIQIIDESVWSYSKQQPTGDTFKYNFENYYKTNNGLFDDMLAKENCSSGINIGLITNQKDIGILDNPKPIEIENIDFETILLLEQVLNQKKIASDNFDLYIDDLLLWNLYSNRSPFLYAIFTRCDHIWVYSQGLLQEGSSLPHMYYKKFVTENQKQTSQSKKDTEWNDIFQKTEFGSSEFWMNYGGKFANTPEAIIRSDILNFLDYKKITYFNFEKDILSGLPFSRKNHLRINSMFLDIQDYPEYFDLPEKNFLSMFSKIFLNKPVIPEITDCMSEESKTIYNLQKQNLIFLLGKEWSLEYIKENTSNQKEADNIFNIFSKMFQKYKNIFPQEKYNYIFKGHPRQNRADLEATTEFFLSGTEIKPIFFNSVIPMELIVNIDLINHKNDKNFELFNLSDYTDKETNFSKCKSLYAGYYIHSTAIETTMLFLSQKLGQETSRSEIHKKIIPSEAEFIMDSFRTDGLGKNAGYESIYDEEKSYDINLNYFQKIFKDLIAIDYYPSFLSFKKFSEWVN